MKLNGIFGKGSGKVGESVWAVSGGVQIVRPYNPNVSNPQTPAQTEQRAKFKLLSQLAAVLAPGMAFKKNGLVSARNQFVSANIGLVTYNNDQAQIDFFKLTLTGKNGYFPEFQAEVDQNQNLGLQLSVDGSAFADAVVYVVTEPTDNEKLLLKAVKVVSTPGANGTFSASIPNIGEKGTVWAYGVKFNSASQKAKYQNYVVTAGLDGAALATQIMSALLAGEATETKCVVFEP